MREARPEPGKRSTVTKLSENIARDQEVQAQEVAGGGARHFRAEY